MSRAIAKILAPMQRRIRLVVSRAIVKLIDPDKKWQELQVVALKDEVLDGIEHVETYGLTSHPHKEAEAILLSQGGRRSNTIAIMVGDRRYRLKGLAEGQVALYDASGSKIVMNNDNTITMVASGGIKMEADLDVTGKVTATGDVASTGGDVKDSTRSMQQMVDQHNAHTQTDIVTGAGISVPVVPMT